MEQTKIASTLRTIGIANAAICGLGGIMLISESSQLVALGLFLIVSGLVVCAMFFGFAEIIRCLQLSTQYQKEILDRLKGVNTSAPNSAKPDTPQAKPIVESDSIESIESALPEI